MQPQEITEKKEHVRFKFEIVYLIPILASLLVGLSCGYLLAPVQTDAVPVTPIPEEIPGAQFGNALYFVVLIGISATLFYVLIKRRNKRIIKALIIVALTTASLLLSVIYLSALFAYFPNFEILTIPLTILFTILFDLVIFRFGGVSREIVVICLGGALGMFFGKFIPLWSAVLILTFLAIYDVFAVYKGPVGKIAASGLDQLEGLSFSFKDIQMGLGDLVFYSMLVGAIFFYFLPNIVPTLASIAGIMLGSVVTLYMLEKEKIFPGLPFPIMFGLSLGLISSFIL